MTGNKAGDHGKKCFCAALLKGGGGVKGREPCSESVERSNVMKGTGYCVAVKSPFELTCCWVGSVTPKNLGVGWGVGG